MSATPPATRASGTAPAPAPAARRCENCGALLHGDHCHGCGQPTKGLVRHFSSVLGDFFDTVFNIDSRVLRTIGPLLFRPGYLSLEYFAGRRVRYVTPMRLFLFLSLLAFFAIQASIDVANVNGNDKELKRFDKAASAAEVEAVFTASTVELDRARAEAVGVPGATAGIDIARAQLRDHADEQIDYLRKLDAAKAANKPLPTPPSRERNNMTFPIGGKPWDPVTNPVSFKWLPQALNKTLNRRMAHARDVLKADSQKPVIDSLFNVLPQTLIVLMPLFALMLKLAYWFRRRMYMEHVIVALHSHGFIALALTLLMLWLWLREWLVPNSGFFNGLLGWMIGLTIAWIPVYLLLMQKRVYAQGWLMTIAKFVVLGICYSVLLGVGLMAAMLIGLLTL